MSIQKTMAYLSADKELHLSLEDAVAYEITSLLDGETSSEGGLISTRAIGHRLAADPTLRTALAELLGELS